MVDTDKLVVNTDAQRLEWVTLLTKASDFHYDMSGLHDEDEEVADVHRAWARAIHDAVLLIDMWQLEETEVVVDPRPPAERATNVTDEVDKSAWVCKLCDKSTFETDYDYLAARDMHLECALKEEMKEEKNAKSK